MNNVITVSNIVSDLVPELANNGIEALLPAHIKAETFARLAAVAIFNNPMLQEADRQSVINSLIMSAKDGLVCDGKEAALVPFKTKVNGRFISKAQYMPMVDGVLKRVRQSGQVTLIASKAVFANDEFDFWCDEDGDHFKHKPTLGEPGELIAVIAYAKMKDGTRHVELLRKWEIDRSREASKQGNNEYGPWAKYYDRMACKTGLHRVARRLPNSTEILEMLERGDPKNFENDRNERDVTPQKYEQADTLSQVLGGELMEEETDITDILTEFETCKDLTEFAKLYQVVTGINGLTDSQKYDLNEAQKAAKSRIKNTPPASQEPVDFE